MNRAFKTVFHGGTEDQKHIVTMSVTVNNGKRFNELDRKQQTDLVNELISFRDKVSRFTAEVIKSMSK